MAGARSGRAWRVGGSALTVLALVWFAWEAVDQFAARTEDRTDVAAATDVRRIVVDVDHGSVAITGRADSREITATARLRVGLIEPEYTFRVTDQTLRISSRCGAVVDSCLQSLTITAPRGVAVQVTTDDDVSVRDLSGEISVTSDLGSIDVTDLAGPVSVESDNGDIVGVGLTSSAVTARSDNGAVTLGFDTAPTTVEASSDNGDVRVVLPRSADVAGVDFAVSVSADNGSVDTPIRTNPSSRRAITARSDNGSVVVGYQP